METKNLNFEELKPVFDEIFAGGTFTKLLSVDSKSESDLTKDDIVAISEFINAVNTLEDVCYWKSCGKKPIEYRVSMHKASRIMSMFSHHTFSNINWLDIQSKKEYRDLIYRILAHDIQECVRFVKDVYDGKSPDTINFHDTRGYATYIAVESKDHYSGIAIKRLLFESEIKDEKKRVGEIVKNRGAYYYEEMLKELKSGDFGKYYVVRE